MKPGVATPDAAFVLKSSQALPSHMLGGGGGARAGRAVCGGRCTSYGYSTKAEDVFA